MFKTIRDNSYQLTGVILSANLFLLTSCSYLPKRACEIPLGDAEGILGSRTLILNDKSKFLPEEGRNMPHVRGCSYVREEAHQDVSSLRWTEIEYTSVQESQDNFKRAAVSERLSSAPGFPKDYMATLGDESFITREKDSGKKIEIAVRKGRSVFMVIIDLPDFSDKSIEEIKTLTSKIADSTNR